MTLVEPSDFPVAWPSPDAAELLWEHDAMHNPEQLLPLEQSFATLSMTDGFVRAARTYELPIEAVRTLFVRGWPYQATVPTSADPIELDAQASRAHQRLVAEFPGLGVLWSKQVLPEVEAELAMIGAPLACLDGTALADRFADATARFVRIWELHFLVVLPAYTVLSEFDELYRELFEEATSLDSLQLLIGQPNLTTILAEELWALAHRASPQVRDVLVDRPTAKVEAALDGVDGAASFRADLAAFLDRWGERIDMWDRISLPTWQEAPEVVIGQLRDLVLTPNDQSPSASMTRARKIAEEETTAARAKLAGYPAEVRALFEERLWQARTATVVTEDHGHFIDFGTLPRLRRLALTAGGILARTGSIDLPDDVFHLDLATVVDNLRAPGDARVVVRTSRRELAAGATQVPPPTLGKMPQHRPAYSVSRYQSKFFGEAPPSANDGGELRGFPGSPGRATGTARIISSLTDADRLAPGDVLVCTTAAPSWTSLFSTVAAVVTDTGGPLSHCAVVARELGIPAVVGTQHASTSISDGQRIEVHGNTGVVYLR